MHLCLVDGIVLPVSLVGGPQRGHQQRRWVADGGVGAGDVQQRGAGGRVELDVLHSPGSRAVGAPASKHGIRDKRCLLMDKKDRLLGAEPLVPTPRNQRAWDESDARSE